MKFYNFVYKYLGPFFRWLFRLEVVGSENEPLEGGLLACPNHISNWDVIILAISLHRPVHFFAKAELFRIPLLKQLVSSLGAFPASRGTADLGALKKTIGLLKDGNIVGFYPQGTRHPGVDPRTTEVKHGVAMITHRSGAPVLPVYINTKNNKILPFRKVKVTLGKIITTEELEMEKGGKEEYERVSKIIFSKITDLMDDTNE